MLVDHFWESWVSFTEIATVTNSWPFLSCSNTESDCSCPQDLPKPPSQYNNLEQVREDSPEVLFYKVAREPGSELFYFKSYLKDKQRILGFDQSGEPLNTSQVDSNGEESWFSVI